MTIHKYPRKELLFLLPSLLALFFLTSCQKQPKLDFGQSYTTDNNSANVVVVDTTTVLMGTTFVDTTSTNGTGYLMVGSYKDDYLGKVTSRAFLQLAPPTSLPTISSVNDRYDSMSLILFFKKSNPWYGDTTSLQSFYVNQVDTLYQLGTFQNAFNSRSSLRINPTPLGHTDPLYIWPNIPNTNELINDTVKIRMDDNFGRTIYNMVYNLSDTVKNNTVWQNWFHGLCVSSDNTGNAIYNFKDSAIMRIYYREAGIVSTVKYIDFNITNKANQFNNIRPDYTGTILKDSLRKPTVAVQPPPITYSKSTNHSSFVQTIMGLNVKLTFPALSSIALRPDYIGLLRAQLIVRPVPGSFNTTWRLPPALGIYLTDQNNQIGTPIPATGVSGAQTGALSLDYFNPLTTVYTYDVTAFVKGQITNNESNASQTGLLLSIPASANESALNRLIIADQSYPLNQRVTLAVYYLSLFPHN